MGLLQIISYLAILLFVVVVAAKMAKIARMPLHLRWDLYPIPHEKGRGAYGGSYYEEVDWWTKPKNFSLFSEIKEMAKEIIFIQSVFHNNRPLWFFSFPFHFGMYCLIGFLKLMVLGAILQLFGVIIAADSGVIAKIIYHLTIIFGAVGWILSIIGAVGLIFFRMFHSEMRKATVLSDFTNLLILLAVFVAGLVSYATVDSSYAILRGFVQNLISFQPTEVLPTAVSVQLWLWAALMFYFPFTHMTHLFGKYFTYHKVRWEDEPNMRGSKIETAVNNALGYTQTWSAPHIKSNSSWAEAATDTSSTEEANNDAS
jgi:nitrate reductase gamma subunit